MNHEEKNKDIQTLGSIVYYNEILRDLQQEPHVVCEWDKRRACDSQYIRMYNQALRDYKQLLDDYTKLNQAYLDVENRLIELQNLMKGGEDECFKKKK